MDPIKVTEETIMSVSTKLSPFKEWICRVFKIEPARLYDHTASVVVLKPEQLPVGSVLLDEGGTNWLVTDRTLDRKVGKVFVNLKTLAAIPLVRRIGSVVILSQSISEGSHGNNR